MKTSMRHKRIIGKHIGKERGPMLVCIGGMHGNELAGVKAIDMMVKMLEVEPITNPGFQFNGMFLGLSGNLKALRRGFRFIEKDLNRLWTQENIDYVLNTPREDLKNEYKEMHDLIKIIQREVQSYQPDEVIILDLHTTTAFGGIFTIASEDVKSLRIAVELHAPVITGLMKGIQGTSLHYFNKDKLGPETICVVFESGQHYEELSVNRAIAAMTNVLSIIGCIDPKDVENQHESLLIEYAKGLPKVAEYVEGHKIEEGDGFKMKPGYQNFQKVQKGELLAEDKHGPIYAASDGLILMPLYQEQGEDGFFLIRELLGSDEPLGNLWESDIKIR
jgi:succinylglutamate desuccinylase